MVHGSSAIPNLVGHTIANGRLKFIDRIGSGSNGVVFLAVDTTTGTECPTKYAVKCLVRAKKGSRRYAIQRQEVALHQRASSQRHVLTLHSVLEDVYYIFLVLEYCPGGDLFTFLSEHTVVRGNDALVKTIFLQILDALEACHKLGIFHRDVKPENILCSADCTRIYLSDFGLATRAAHSVTYGCGSSYYMSPECLGVYADRKGYDTRANDVWALGVILTSMISGHNPWRSASPADPCYFAYLRDPSFLLHMLPISVSANTILRSIFTTDPARRISIAKLRLLVLRADTFFLSASEIARANPRLQTAAAQYYKHTPTGRLARPSPAYSGSGPSPGPRTPPGLQSDCAAYLNAVHARLTNSPPDLSYFDGTEICRVPRTHPTNSASGDTLSLESVGPPTPSLESGPHSIPDVREAGGCEGKKEKEFLKPAVARVMSSGRRARFVSTGFIRRIAGLIPVA